MGLMPRGLRAAQFQPRVERVKCQATVEDYKNGSHFNLSRSFTVPDHRQCSRYARSKVGTLCLCALHTKLAVEGLIDETGTVATRSSLADVRKYPKKFPDGLYTWARNLKVENLP